MPTEVVNTASAFTIAELAGQRRQVRLVARALPYRPFTLKTAQRVQITWYGGNPIGSSTVTGSKREPTQLNGMWKDKYISTTVEAQTVAGLAAGLQPNVIAPMTLDGEPVQNVVEAVRLFESLCEEGQLLEVVWDEQTRHGHLESFEASWENRHDVQWSMNFLWVSKGEAQVPAVFVAETSVSDSAGVFRAMAGDVSDAAADSPFAEALAFRASLAGALESVEERAGSMLDTAAGLAELALTPAEAVRQAVAISTSLAEDLANLRALMASQVAGAFDAAVPLAEQSYGERIAADVYAREVQSRALAMRAEVLDRRSRQVQASERTIIGTVIASEGEDLRDVSRRFYNTPFEWRRLASFNSLDDTRLSAGQVVLVPQLSTAEEPC